MSIYYDQSTVNKTIYSVAILVLKHGLGGIDKHSLKKKKKKKEKKKCI